MKRLCPQCESQRQAPAHPQPEFLPPERTDQQPPPREVEFPPPTVTRVLIGINVAVFLVMAITTRRFVEFQVEDLVRWGANFGPYTLDGQWWRMLASTFLHGGILHIVLNMWALRNIGYTAELFYGRRNYLFIYLLSGLGGSAASLLRGARVSVGASGAIFGVAGALAVLVYFKKLPIDRAILRKDIGSIGIVIIANLVLGARIAAIDNSAHVGGLIAGAILGLCLPAAIFRVERQKSPTLGNAAVIGVSALIVVVCLVARATQRPQIEIQRAYNAQERGDLAAAQAHAQRALQLAPNDPRTRVLMCSISVDQQSLSAVEECEKAVHTDPSDPVILSLLAAAYEHAGKSDAATNVLQRVLQLDPDSFEANYNLGRLYLDQGKANRAIPFFRAAVRLKPSDSLANRALERALAASK